MTSPHKTRIVRSGDGLMAICETCRARQMKPVPTKQDAEDWEMAHHHQVTLALIDPTKKLKDTAYLAYLQSRADDKSRPAAEQALWKQLAEEFEPRVKGKKSSFDTGVETEPLW